jgi:hypothetical protein
MSPIRRSLYPPDWHLTSARLRHIRAGDRCECDGRCGSPRCPAAMLTVARPSQTWRCTARRAQPHPVTGSKVVLTVAHLDRNAAAGDHSDGNLMVMCQCCHLAYDRQPATP